MSFIILKCVIFQPLHVLSGILHHLNKQCYKLKLPNFIMDWKLNLIRKNHLGFFYFICLILCFTLSERFLIIKLIVIDLLNDNKWLNHYSRGPNQIFLKLKVLMSNNIFNYGKDINSTPIPKLLKSFIQYIQIDRSLI